MKNKHWTKVVCFQGTASVREDIEKIRRMFLLVFQDYDILKIRNNIYVQKINPSA